MTKPPPVSTLELMLESLQQLEDRPKDAPPALPVRPVSRARLPRARKQLPFDFQKKSGREEGLKSQREAETNGIPIGVLGNSKERGQKGIIKIQKCYRGHQIRGYYSKLKRGVIDLQSFIRGENSRKEYRYRVMMLKAAIAIQKHVRGNFAYRARKERHAAVTCLQSGIRGWLSRRHFDQMEQEKKLIIKNERDDRNPPKDKEERILVQNSFIVDLYKKALRTEAKLRKKNEENAALRMQLQQIEEKWRAYEEKMKSMEKIWQDQFTYIQTCLAAANKNSADEMNGGKLEQYDATLRYQNGNADDRPGNYHGRNLAKPLDLPSSNRSRPNIITSSTNHVRDQLEGITDGDGDQIKLQPHIELRKLKLRFKTWRKEYKTRLLESEATIKKLSHIETDKNRKRWWERQVKKGI